jgi:hypothetical protein
MAHVISSLKTVQERLLAAWQTRQAAAKTRPQAAPTETSRATTSFRALLSGKAASATLPVGPQGPAPALVAAALPATQGRPLIPAPAAVAADDAPAQNSAPTAQSVFGANPWLADPTGTAPDGSSYNYNPLYFATTDTAAQVAQMVGGTVVASDQLAPAGTPFVQQQPNQMVELANGTLINPGLVASFYTHGYPQSYIDVLVANEVGGSAT